MSEERSPDAIESRSEIEELLLQYCRSMDRRDNPLGYRVFHEDAVVDYGDLFTGSGRDFVDWACAYHQTLESHHHEIGRTLLQVRGDRAVSETYVTVTVLAREGTVHLLRTAVGRYLDRLERRDGRWAIAHRRYVRSFRWDQRLDGVVVGAVHTEEDPSYALFASIGPV